MLEIEEQNNQSRINSFMKRGWYRKAFLFVPAALIMGALLSSLDGTGSWISGWLAYSTLTAGAMGLLLAVERLTGAGRARKAAWTAFILRLALGVFLFLILPTAGYPDNRATQSGYTFDDAFVRDQQAWKLATSEAHLVSAFSGSYAGDQYGGMMALSATVYRYLSPDFHRPFLVLIIGAAVAACGVFFIWRAAEVWFGPKIGLLAGWIFALYPESVLLGSSHMREPFIMTAAAMTLFSISIGREKRWVSFAWLILGIFILLLFQPPIALFTSIVVFGIWFFDQKHKFSWKQAAVFSIILIVSAGTLILVWSGLPSLSEAQSSNVVITWFYNNFVYQTHLTERSSGWLQKIFSEIGNQWQMPFVLVYGITRPVLPAALGDRESVLLVWRVINIFRAAGWYALALPLVYGVFLPWRIQNFPRRSQILWLFSMIWLWILISSAVAGGDMWDNPRYRTIFLGFYTLMAAWAVHWAIMEKDPWLLRLLYVELVAIAAMTVWYISRNYIPWFTLNIWPVLGIILVLSALILIRGWRSDRKNRREIQSLGLG
jgi:hypothetical protein